MTPPLSQRPLAGMFRSLLSALLCGVVYTLLASPAANLQDSATLAPIAAPAPALMIALLWRKPARDWFPYLLAVFVAMLVVGDRDSLPVQVDAGFALLNVVQIVACLWLGRRFVSRDGQFDGLYKLGRFLALLPLLVVALVAALGATLAADVMPAGWWAEWRTLLVGNGLAILVLTPTWLVWSQLHWRSLRGDRPSVLGAVAVVAVLLACAACDWSGEVQRVLLSLVLAGAALYGGMRSATLVTSLAAVMAVLLTLYDIGPYRQEGLDSTWSLQVDLAGLAILTFFIAVAMRERQALAARMEQMRRFESLGLMAGGIAHDFNNVLGAAGGYAELAQEQLDPDAPAQRPLSEVVSAVRRGRELTEQILLAGRRGDRQRSLLDLREPVAEAVQLARPLCRAGVVIEFLPPAQPLAVQGHAGQLSRVALNLIRNASQAARSRVVVSLHAGEAPAEAPLAGDLPQQQAVWLEVVDDGSGIAPQHLSRLFEPFFTTRDGPGGKGTGLGLAIVAGIAIEHEGGVAVASDTRGTRFRLLLPAATATAAATNRAPPAPAPESTTSTSRPNDDEVACGQGQCIFVVDDDAGQRTLCAQWLDALGYAPIVFDDPLLALEEFALEPLAVDLVITDLDMPQMQGDALIVALREMRADLPVVLCSGQPHVLELAATLGVAGLGKPLERSALRRAIMTALPDTEQGTP
ncbi:MASE1 domain-containing protein [Herbaspirillum sp. AP02]|uniref:ATP-binding protein n=1 Tax=unclassified Herbaspirillum TaxID=2624150 RepID=UPI0015DBCB83|nr:MULTISPECIES: ATP-binding protein [unclassified Herbaspirillum]MBG7620361.1 MASE1 domain-containing protein [Herbaspirillum sp. AP02]NZD67825.1 MASE1 domain-containing protein [Herbaspirillum sp. AP21]